MQEWRLHHDPWRCPVIAPREWLKRDPLQPGEQLFAVLGSASDYCPVAAWRESGEQPPEAIWAGTEYAQWEPVMPHAAVVAVDSAFLDWAAECEGRDWGWLAVSTCPLPTVVAHLRSLTKVLMPDGQAVFFRFWDGTYLLPMLQAMGSEAKAMLPVFHRYWINGELHALASSGAGPAKSSPWWAMSEAVLQVLADHSSVTQVENLLQWLEEERPDLHGAFAAATLRHKVAYFVRMPHATPAALADYLALESG